MKFSNLLAAAILTLTPLCAHAEVLIYSGTAKMVELEVRARPFIRKVFLVTDPARKSTQLVTYGKLNRVKSRGEEDINVGDFLGGALTTGGPLIDIYTFLKQDDTGGIVRQSLFVRGFQRDVQISINQGKPVVAKRAKFLKGSIRKLAGGIGSTYQELELSVALDKARTVDANVRGISAAAAYGEISAYLEALGYTNL
jgi:hypothetical protein